MIVKVDEPFSSFFCTACKANSAGLSIQYSSFSLSSDSLTAEINLLEYTPESIPNLLQPPTPSATIMMFLDTNSASSPPFQTLSGCGAQPQPTRNSQRFSPAWLVVRKIFFLVSLPFILLFKSKLYSHLLASSSALIIIMLQSFLLLLLVSSASSSTYMITQQFFTQEFTDNDILTYWNPTGASLPLMKFSTCSGHRIVGGYNVFVGDTSSPNQMTRTWSNLIPHYSITFTAKFYKIDSWVNNTIFFMVDGVTAQLYTFTAANGGTTDFCGNPTPVTDSINTSFNDLIVAVSFTVPHTASALTIKIISNLVSSSGSWGIRDLMITMAACDESCLTCTTGTACTTCDAGQGLTLSGSFCVCSSGYRQRYIPCSAPPCAVCVAGSCANGFYYSGTTLGCEPCNVACATCLSPVNSAASCISCATGFVGNPHATACFSCFSGCASCTTTASNSCTSCSYGYFFTTSNTCVTQCPSGFFGEEKSKLCIGCSSPCAACNGDNGGSYYCLSCIAGNYLYSYTCAVTCPIGLYGYQGVCVSSCPATTYADSGTLTCLACTSNCGECTNGTSCFICSSGSYMLLGLCYTTCPVNYFGSNQTQLCLTCHSSCLTCDGPFSDNCLSCPIGVVLISRVCYTTCPNNTYSLACLACDTSCLACTGPSSTNCITCSSPLFYHINYSSCLSSCNVGEISNNYNFTCTLCPSNKVAYFEVCRSCSPTCMECKGISFLECTACWSGTSLTQTTCVLNGQPSIIYMPQGSSNNSVRNAFMAIFLLHLFLSLFLEIIFQYKTNLLATIELLQILSYTQFLTIELTQSTQRLAHFLYLTNFAAFLSPVSVTPSPSLPAKFQVMGKTGYFLADAFGIQLVMLICLVGFLSSKYLSHRSQLFLKVYQKINPYLLTYTFRLVLLELSLDVMLYLYCFDASSGIGVGSLVMLVVDMIALVFSLCWRIKTEQDGTQVALFYCNQVGQTQEKEQQQVAQDEHGPNTLQQKIKKNKILPSVMELLLKLPISITILYFIGNYSTQTICFFIYFGFYLLLTAIIPVRRRIYRSVMLLNSSFLLLNAFGALLVSKGATSSLYFDGVWLTILLILLIISLMQAISNYRFFIQAFSYLRYRVKHGLSNEQLQQHNEAHSNLTSQEQQSVVFEKQHQDNLDKKQLPLALNQSQR